MEKTSDKMDNRKEQILKAAQRCFSRYGFYKTTLDDIAAAVGLKKAALYYYYKNKESLFGDVIERETDQFFRLAEEKIAGEATATDRLLCYIRTKMGYFQQVMNFHNLSVQIVLEVQPVVDRLYQNIHQKDVEFTAMLINEGSQSGEFKDCDSMLVAGAIISLVEALRFKELQSTDVHSAADIDYAKLENEIIYILNLFIHGIKV